MHSPCYPLLNEKIKDTPQDLKVVLPESEDKNATRNSLPISTAHMRSEEVIGGDKDKPHLVKQEDFGQEKTRELQKRLQQLF